MSTLLLLSLFLFPAGTSGLLATNGNAPVATDSSKTLVSQPAAEAQDSEGNSDQRQIDSSPGMDHVCFKIRAFIFETNDDQVPRFVRETTCPPATAGAKKIDGTAQPKLVPAIGDDQF